MLYRLRFSPQVEIRNDLYNENGAMPFCYNYAVEELTLLVGSSIPKGSERVYVLVIVCYM